MTLTISIVHGDVYSTETSMGIALHTIAHTLGVERKCGQAVVADQAHLDVVFHTPGVVLEPDWSGVHVRRFSKKENMLRVQVAVPENQMNAPDPYQYIFKMIGLAIDASKPRFQNAGAAFSVEDHRAYLDRVEESFDHRP